MHEDTNRAPVEADAAVVEAGAAAARGGGHRTDNPYDPDTETWLLWRDGYDQQTVWLQLGRGEYHVGTGTRPASER